MVTSTNPAARSPSWYSWNDNAPEMQPTSGATLGQLRVGELVIGDNVADSQATARPEDPVHLGEHPRLVRGQVDNAVRDHDVDGVRGERDLLDIALQELDVRRAGLVAVLDRQSEHLLGHIEPVHLASRSDALGREQHVDTAARPEVEHGLAGMKVCDSRGVAATEAREDRSFGKLLLGQLPVELGSGGVALLRAGLAGMTTVLGGTGTNGHSARRFGVAAPNVFTKIGVVRHYHILLGGLRRSVLVPQSCKGRLKRCKARRHEGVPDPLAPSVTDDEPGIAEHLQVVTHCRLTLAERFDEVADADLASLSGGENRDDSEAGRVSQCGEALRQFERAGIVEWGSEDRRAAHVVRGFDHGSSLGHASPSPIDISECIDHYKRIDDCGY